MADGANGHQLKSAPMGSGEPGHVAVQGHVTDKGASVDERVRDDHRRHPAPPAVQHAEDDTQDRVAEEPAEPLVQVIRAADHRGQRYRLARRPAELVQAAQNGILEEVLVLGYLLRRLDQLGWAPGKAIALAAVVRGSYHLYQGFGGFLGNAILGVIFGVLYRRWGRVTPMIIAHTLIDAGAFVGYVALHGHVSWLP